MKVGDFVEYFKQNLKSTIIILTITLAVWVLLMLGLLPTYSSNELERKASHFFPVWVCLFLLISAYLGTQSAPEEKKESEPEKPKEENADSQEATQDQPQE